MNKRMTKLAALIALPLLTTAVLAQETRDGEVEAAKGIRR